MKFYVIEPASLTEAVDILSQAKDIILMAGGTDLLVKVKQGRLKPGRVLSLRQIQGLERVEYVPGRGLFIGPMATHAQVAAHPEVICRFSALAEACSAVGSPQIRNVGTVAGNLANASPAADTAGALLALEAQLMLMGPQGSRRVALADFLLGPGKTCLGQGELIAQIFAPEPQLSTFSTYLKLGRRKAMEIAVCSVALASTSAGNGWSNVQLALGAVGPTTLLSKQAGNVLEGQVWSEQVSILAGKSAASECQPVDDQRASASYRRAMVEVMVKRAISRLEFLKG